MDKESQLITKFKETGDQKFLAELYKPYMSLVYGLCLKYFRNTHDAEDAAMDVYISIGNKLMRHDVNNFKSWLYVVTKNHCLDKLRSRGTKTPKEKEAQLMYSEEVFHPDSNDDDSEVKQLKKCMETLSDDQRNCVNMFYFQKRSYEEITKATKYSWGQVRSYIQNGRRNLKNCMEKA
ncbi:MAG: sigma-70 family RNA polymerase sigma factor [Saprospiraceae bacterium]|nr:sigma-70 family RNA polymerase sigma factor [Saprospiraceae bacterium]